jgi:hypothetical protein
VIFVWKEIADRMEQKTGVRQRWPAPENRTASDVAQKRFAAAKAGAFRHIKRDLTEKAGIGR